MYLLGRGVHEEVIELLVIGIIKAQLLELPFQIPVRLCNEDEGRIELFDPVDGFSPEFLCRCRGVFDKRSPGFFKYAI